MAVNLKLKNNALIKDIFKKLSYIESTGTQYIDTGICPADNDITFKIGISFISNVTQNNTFIGAGESNRSQASSAIFRNSSGHLAINWGQWTSNGTIVYQNCPINTLMELEIKAGSYVKVNGNTTSVVPSNVSYSTGKSANFILGGISEASSNSIFPKLVRTHYFIALKNGIELIHLIPKITNTGKPRMYDTVSNNYYYNNGTGDFVAGYSDTSTLKNSITTAYVKDCPNVSGIDILRQCSNLTRVRLDIGNVSGSIEELMSYSSLNGFNDNYEPQTKPRIIGTWTINSYHTNAERNNIDIDGLTVLSDNNYNIDYLLENNLIAVQTIDSTKEGYNQPVANVLIANNIGHTTVSDSSKFFVTKAETAAITSLPNNMFRGNTNIITFNEFKYWTGLTSLANGADNNTNKGAFGDCTSLESIELPEGITSIGNYSFYNASSLHRIVLPSTLIQTGNYSFVDCSGMADGYVYFNGTLEQWMNITISSTGVAIPTRAGAHLYIQGNELTNLIVPLNINSIKYSIFAGCKYITNLVLHDNVTAIQGNAFNSCTGLQGVLDIKNVFVGSYGFTNCTNLTDVYIKSAAGDAFSGCSNLRNLVLFNNSTDNGLCGKNAGNGTGKLEFYKSLNYNPNGNECGNWKSILVHESVNCTSAYAIFRKDRASTVVIRVNGNLTTLNGGGALAYNPYSYTLKFIEVNGTYNSKLILDVGFSYNGFINHLGYNGIAGTVVKSGINNARCAKVYVGSGLSRQDDEAVLALYLADSNWGTYSSKLSTWYDYNGEFKWYYITDNLTDCINTNPDAWPHITRGESYQTTIEPDEGMTLSSVQVQMLDTDTTSPTYDTMVDITSSVYDSSTGEIDIPSVTGNVVITASAS